MFWHALNQTYNLYNHPEKNESHKGKLALVTQFPLYVATKIERLFYTFKDSNTKDVSFGSFVDTAAHLRGHSPRSPSFWGMNRRF